MIYLAFVLVAALFYFIGLMQNGININHNGYELEKDEEGNPKYNQSMVNELPEEVRRYYEIEKR